MRRRFTIAEVALHESGHLLPKIIYPLDDLKKIHAVVLDEPDADGLYGYVESFVGQRQIEAHSPPAPREKWRPLPKEIEKYAPIADRAERLSLARKLILYYAGCAAQYPLQPGYALWCFDSAAKDMRDSDEAAWKAGYWPPRKWQMAYFAAVEFVDSRFGELIALSRALETRRELMGPEILEIVARAPKYRNPHRKRGSWPGEEAPDHALAAALVNWRDPGEPIVFRAAAMSEGQS
jgi:hypothetical protein